MAKNQITGKVIAFSNVETVASKDPQKEPFKKRSLYLDCTFYDQFGNKGRDNTPLLEFGGKALEKLEEVINQGLKKDDIVTVEFFIQGDKTVKDGKPSVFTHIRPSDIYFYKPQQQGQAPAPTPQAAAPQQAAPTPPPAPEPEQEQLPF